MIPNHRFDVTQSCLYDFSMYDHFIKNLMQDLLILNYLFVCL